MVFTSVSPSRRHHGSLLILALLGACASQSQSTTRLPFHVAIAPAVPEADASSQPAEGNPTDLVMVFDQQKLMEQLGSALAQTFCKVSRLSPAAAGSTPAASAKAWITEAQQKGADLMLVPTLRYDPKIQTALNGQFVLNLPLFAVGGPFCWFVADRSYYCSSRLNGELFDVTVAAARQRQNVDASSRVLRVEREATEASLNFLQRANGVTAYLLSVICPAGLLATESVAVPAALDTAVVSQLCLAMAKSLQDRRTEITETELVDFFPRDVRAARDGNKKVLVGEMVLKIGEANELGKLRYRFGASENFREAAWEKAPPTPAGAGSKGRKVYPFKIPLDGAKADTVQLEVEQLDRFATRRTFTFVVEQTPAQ